MHFIAYNIAANKQRKEEYLYCVFKRADVLVRICVQCIKNMVLELLYRYVGKDVCWR